MVYPGANAGAYAMGGDPNSLEARKKQLLQKLMDGQQNQSGLTGLHSMPLYGGVGRGSGGGDFQGGALPSLTFNPFLAMAAGRPDEQFQAPNGVTQAALAQAQAGFDPVQGGGSDADPSAAQNVGDSGQQAGAVFTGAAAPSQAGIAGSPAAADPSGYAQAAAAGGVRHLLGPGGNNRQTGLQPFFGSYGGVGRMTYN